MATGFSPYIDEVFEYVVRRDTVHISVQGEPVCSTPVFRAEAGLRALRKALDDYYASQAEVVPLRRRKAT